MRYPTDEETTTRSTAARVLLLIFGALMVILGISLFSTPIANSVATTYIVTALMLAYGISEIYHYFAYRKVRHLSGWVLADGIITALLAALLLFRPGAQLLTFSTVFAVWVLFSGVMRTSAAFTAREFGSHSWGWILAAGILGILVGLFLMFDPVLAIMTIGFLLPAAFIMQGISAMAMFFSTGERDK